MHLMAGALAMAWGHCVALLLLLTPLGLGRRPLPAPGLPGLWHSYDCGVRGMQLLVFPREGQIIRFKVMDEFGNQFEVNNCSSCYHWVSAKPEGPVVFSADYKGCHVLEKDGRSHLRVFIEAVLPNGHIDIAQNVTLVCPKPDQNWTTPDDPLVTPTTFSLSALHTRPLPPTAEHSFDHTTPASPILGSGPTHPTWTHPYGGTLEPWVVDKPDYIGTHPTPEQCQRDSGHIPCIVRSSKEACQQAGCCYDNTREVPCYYGNTATVQCFKTGHFILVVSQETALAHRITLASIHLAYAPTSCSPTQETGSFVVFHFPLTHCGTTVQVIGNQLIYENQLVSDIDVQMGPQGSITRDGTFRLHVRCIFNASDFLPLQAVVFPSPFPASVTQPGSLRLELRIAKDETFRSYYEERDYPLVKLLLEPVPLEVRLLQRTDPHLVLVLHHCWATPSAHPFQQPQWPILSDGCPFEGDSYKTRMVAVDKADLPFPAHYQRFTVTTFTFLDSGSERALRGPVYFFCSASACTPSGPETCSARCGSRPASSTRNSDLKPPIWAVLLLVAVALVLGIAVYAGLSQTQAKRLQEGNRE